MLKRIAISLGLFFSLFLLGSGLVGDEVISAEAGACVWLLGLIGAVVAFVITKPKAG